MDYAFREFLESTPPDERASTEELLFAYHPQSKSTFVGYLLFYFFFPIGAHRFYLGFSRSALLIPAAYFLTIALWVLLHSLGAPKPLLMFPIGVALSTAALWLWDLAFLSNWVYEHNRDVVNRLNAELLRVDTGEANASD